MNKEQIKQELEKRKSDLAFWVEQFDRVMGNDSGMWKVCEMQINKNAERIGQLKRMESKK